MYWLIVALTACLPQIEAAAQPNPSLLDSLRSAVAAAPDDSSRLNGYLKLGNELFRAGQREEAAEVLQQGVVLARRLGRTDRQIILLLRLNTLYRLSGADHKSWEAVQEAVALSRRMRDTLSWIKALQNLGATYRYQGDYTQAIAAYLEAMRLNERINEPDELAGILNNLGNVYRQLDEFDKARDCYTRSLAIRLQHQTNNRDLGIVLGNLGNLAFRQQNYPLALDYYQQSLDKFRLSGHIDHQVHRLNNIGQSLARLGRFGQAIDSLQRSLELLANRQNHEMKSEAATALAEVYYLQGRPSAAQPLLRQALSLARLSGNREQMQETAQLAYRIDSALGQFGTAFWHLLLYQQLSDSLKNESQAKAQGRLESKYEFEKAAEIERLRRAEEQRLEAARTNWLLGSAGGGLLLLSIVAFTLFQSRRRAKQANTTLRRLNEQLAQQKAETDALNAELQATLQEVSNQRQRLETQHAQIEDSIHYASRIQQAILPAPALLARALPPHFIHYQPRDIVSGDFYWLAQIEDITLLAAVDCTGHGVPGAFMSVVGTNLLQQIVSELGPARPGAILKALDRRIIQTLHQQAGSDSKDGMDVCLLALHPPQGTERRVEYAGAGRPLWLLRGGLISEYRSARYACGGSQHADKQYPVVVIDGQAGDRLFAFSDGVVDQFGGPEGRKLGTRRLQAQLEHTAHAGLADQGAATVAFLHAWQGTRRQLDDILLIGLEL